MLVCEQFSKLYLHHHPHCNNIIEVFEQLIVMYVDAHLREFLEIPILHVICHHER